MSSVRVLPLDYYADYYRQPPVIYDLSVEAQSLISNNIEMRPVSNMARFFMPKHEAVVLDGMASFVEGKWARAAIGLDDALKTFPGHNDVRILAALCHYFCGKPRAALNAITPLLEQTGAVVAGRYFKAWLPSLRVLIKLDHDVVVPFYPNRLGMFFLAMAIHRELGDLKEAGNLCERAANEYFLIDEMLYIAVLLHLQMGHGGDAWSLIGARTYKNNDSLDVGLTMLRAEAILYKHGLNYAISEYRAALQFTRGRNPLLITRALYRLSELYRAGGFMLDEFDTRSKIDVNFLPEHLRASHAERLAELSDRIAADAPKEGDVALDPAYHMRFDYIWRGKKERDQQVEFLEM